MSCAFNLFNDLGERRTHRRLLTMTGQINKHSQRCGPLAAGELLVYAKEKDPNPTSRHLFKCYLLFIRGVEASVAH